MKCVGNSESKSPGEIERKTYGTGGLIEPQAHGLKLIGNTLIPTLYPTTTGVPQAPRN